MCKCLNVKRMHIFRVHHLNDKCYIKTVSTVGYVRNTCSVCRQDRNLVKMCYLILYAIQVTLLTTKRI